LWCHVGSAYYMLLCIRMGGRRPDSHTHNENISLPLLCRVMQIQTIKVNKDVKKKNQVHV
jgi:hypothetical protein